MCHEDFNNASVHSPVAQGKCLTCHAHHSAKNSDLLVQPLNIMCLICHENVLYTPHVIAGTLSGGHPLSGEKDPLRKDRPFTCVSCHNPHGSESEGLLRFKSRGTFSLCRKCHDK
jgi:predicted CXXCH cytochrome family protein